MTTQTTARGTRTARKRAATEERAPAAARRGRAAGAATQERRPEPRKRATKAQKRQPTAPREPEPTTQPIPQQRMVARRGRATAPQEPPPQPVPLQEETAEQKRTEAAPGSSGVRGIRLPVIGARIPLPPPATGLPGPAHVLWLGGLVGAAALGVVEWPVAAALAAGTWMIERFAKATVREELRHAGERRE